MSTPPSSKSSTARPDHDGSYRKLFSERLMVQGLLEGYVSAPLRADLDLSQDLVPLNLHHVLPHSQRMGEKHREGDVAFLVQNQEDAESSHTFLMLEFQSSIHPRMDVRMAVYAGLIWLQADRSDADKPDWAGSTWGPLAPVLPIVLYNGEKRWNRKSSLRPRVKVGAKPALRALQPDMDFHLIDIARVKVPHPPQTPCDVLFALERCHPGDDLRPLIDRLITLTADAKFDSLREAFLGFMIDVLEGRKIPIDRQTVRDLKGLQTMLGQNIDKMREEDRLKGLEQGLEQGRVEAAVTYLITHLERALTPTEQQRLVTRIQTAEDMVRLFRMDPRELEDWLRDAPSTEGNGTSSSGKPSTKRRPKA